jgi:hypothetical protein
MMGAQLPERNSLRADSAERRESIIVVRPKGGRLALVSISDLIRGEGGELLATGPAGGARSPAYRLRVTTSQLAGIVAVLRSHGHRILRQKGRSDQPSSELTGDLRRTVDRTQ